MRGWFFIFGALVAALLAACQVEGQPLPKLALRPVFRALQCSNLVWMEEAPDGSGRFAIVEQDGRVLLARKATDGADAKEFLNIEDRQPHASLEQGLLSMAFHPGHKTNGLFYLCYSRQRPLRTIISECKVSADNPDRADTNAERVLLEIPQPTDVHHGGLLSFGPEGARYIDPVMEYPHNTNLLTEAMYPRHSFGACVIGGYVYRGARHPSLRGIYIYGDYALGTFWGFRCVNGKVTEYGTLLEQPKNITSFAQDLEGELYVLMMDGHIYSIAAAGEAN